MQQIKHFYLQRNEDVSGKSGTGIVARGVIFESGKIIMEWRTYTHSLSIFDSLENLIEVHGHEGKTQVIMGDPTECASKKKKGK